MTEKLSRREFLKLSGLSSLLAFLPPKLTEEIVKASVDPLTKKHRFTVSRAGIHQISARVTSFPGAQKAIFKILKNKIPIASQVSHGEHTSQLSVISHIDPAEDFVEFQIFQQSSRKNEIPKYGSMAVINRLGDVEAQVFTNKSKQVINDQTYTILEFDSSLYDNQ